MRNGCIILICCLLLQIGCSKPSIKPEVTPYEITIEKVSDSKTESGPKIRFEEVVHDFGKVAPGTKNICQFEFKNVGDALLVVEDVGKSCGCTPFSLAKKKYEPGESGVLKVSYNASKHRGKATKYLYVNSNDKKKPKVSLTIKADVVLKVSVNPHRLNLSLAKPNAGCPDVTLTATDNQTFMVAKVTSTSQAISFETNRDVEATKFVLKPTVDKYKLKKIGNGNVTFYLTHPDCDKITIPFSAMALYKTQPSSIILINAEPLKPLSRHLYILSNYNKDFQLQSVESSFGFIKVVNQKKIGNRYKLDLEITPPVKKEGQQHFADLLKIKTEQGEELEVTCRGFYSTKK